MLLYFIKAENNSDFQIVAQNPEFHGTDGPLGVMSDPNQDIFLREVQNSLKTEFGIPIVDQNGPNQAGSSLMQLTIKDGFRSSSANAYVDPNPNPKNLFISLNSFVTRILFSEVNGKPTATGVQFDKNGHKFVVRAKREIILSAGMSEKY